MRVYLKVTNEMYEPPTINHINIDRIVDIENGGNEIYTITIENGNSYRITESEYNKLINHLQIIN